MSTKSSGMHAEIAGNDIHDKNNREHDENDFQPETLTFSPQTTNRNSEMKCSCPNQCQLFEKIPLDHGIMIMLHDPSSFHQADSDNKNNNNNKNDALLFDDNESSPKKQQASKLLPSMEEYEQQREQQQQQQKKSQQQIMQKQSCCCTCLKIQSQPDANLPQFHPNIYIPSPLLEDPSKLIKYGGGGSGVTVFGGHHPQLGSLVMKHGGKKDLVELVSLVKIEREMGVRANSLERECGNNGGDNENGGVADSSSAGNLIGAVARENNGDENGIVADSSSSCGNLVESSGQSNSSGIGGNDHGVIVEESETITTAESSILDGFDHLPAFGKRMTSSLSINRVQAMAKMTSQPILSTMNSMINTVSTFQNQQLVKAKHGSMPDSIGGAEGDANEEDKKGDQDGAENKATSNGTNNEQIQILKNALEDMKKRIPAFRMIYISPMHLREREGELANNTFRSSRVVPDFDPDILKRQMEQMEQNDSIQEETQLSEEQIMRTQRMEKKNSVTQKGRSINLFGAPNVKSSSFHVHSKCVDLCFGGHFRRWEGPNNQTHDEKEDEVCSMCHQSDGSDGYASMMAFVNQLHDKQEEHDWKVTLAQQTIGQSSSATIKSCTTASSLLVQGKLHGPLLHHLIDQEIRVIRNLQLLTMPEEMNVVDQVRSEYAKIMSRKSNGENVTAADVSPLADMFVGKAILKNFHPVTGRLVMLRNFGRDLAMKRIHLKPKEVVPAKHLMNLFCRKYHVNQDDVFNPRLSVDETFVLPQEEQHPSPFHSDHAKNPIFASGLDQWQSLLELALSMKQSSATNRIWTCGLTDGGLHNLFLNEEYLWMFDLGEPSLEPVPAFLTKVCVLVLHTFPLKPSCFCTLMFFVQFLMSFFHALGMEEDEKGDWVVRFDENGEKLQLTEQTKELLPKVVASFNVTVDRLINELFDGDDEVRLLLVRYACFLCLIRRHEKRSFVANAEFNVFSFLFYCCISIVLGLL